MTSNAKAAVKIAKRMAPLRPLPLIFARRASDRLPITRGHDLFTQLGARRQRAATPSHCLPHPAPVAESPSPPAIAKGGLVQQAF